VRRRAQRAAFRGGLIAAVALAVTGFVLLGPAVALGAPVVPRAASGPTVGAGSGGALLLQGDPPGTVHDLVPGQPALWNVGVTVRRTPVTTLVGVLTAQGGITSGDTAVPVDVELLGCPDHWAGDACAGGERVILSATPVTELPDSAASLADPARPVPASMWVQARVTLADDAPQDSTGELDVRLTVDASGADQPAGGSGVGTGPLAATGSSPWGASLLAVAAVGGGMAVVGLVRLRRRRHE
jgi:hypothetical protein